MAEELSRAHGTVVVDLDASRAKQGSDLLEKTIRDMESKVEKELASIQKGMDRVGDAAINSAADVKKLEKAIESAQRRKDRIDETRQKQGFRAAASSQIEEEKRLTRQLSAEERIRERQKEEAARRATLKARANNQTRIIESREAEKRITSDYISAVRQREMVQRQLMGFGGRQSMSGAWQGAMNASLTRNFGIPQSAQQTQTQQMYGAFRNTGQSPSGAFFSALNWQIAQQNQAYRVQNAINNAPPPNFGGGGGGRGPGGGGPNNPNNFFGPGGLGGRIVGGLRGGLGMGLGAYGIVQGARAVVDASDAATAYDRQRVAAERLAGSTQALNELINAYNVASGGAVANTVALENVTRLQATGFARNAAQVERFVRGTRGASIALGKPQDYIIQETQLAVSNLSFKRLDQIGLGVDEVHDKIEALRKGNRSLTQEQAFSEAVIGLLNEKYGTLSKTLEGQATGLEKLRKKWADLRLEMGQAAQKPVNETADFISMLLGGGAGVAGYLQRQNRTSQAFTNQLFDTSGLSDLIGALTGRTGTQVRAQRALNQGLPQYGPRGDSPEGDYVQPYAIAPRFTEQQMSALSDARDRQLQIEDQYNKDRLREIENYESQRTQIVRNYAKQMAREEEDFARQRARSNRDYNKQIEEVIEDAEKRDEQLVEDYTERTGEMREDSEKRISELQEDYQKERERAEEAHRDNLLRAAGQLDAIAVLEERKRFRREQKERDEQHKERIDDERDKLQEQMQEAKEAFDERLEDAREADRERLEDMQEAREQQLADEDEDRRIRLERAAEDHADQLGEMDRQHGLRLKQIEEQAAEEREKWRTEFEKLLTELDIPIKGLKEKEEERQKLVEDWFEMIENKIEDDIKADVRRRERAGLPQGTYYREEYSEPFSGDPGYASGGRVRSTGLAKVHRGEFVLSRSMLSGRSPVPASVANATSNNNSRSIEIHPGAIALYPAPGMDEMGMLDALEDRLIELLEAA